MVSFTARQWWHTPLIPVTTQVAIENKQYTPLIPAIERIIRKEETALRHGLTLRFSEAGSPFWTEVEVRAVLLSGPSG